MQVVSEVSAPFSSLAFTGVSPLDLEDSSFKFELPKGEPITSIQIANSIVARSLDIDAVFDDYRPQAIFEEKFKQIENLIRVDYSVQRYSELLTGQDHPYIKDVFAAFGTDVPGSLYENLMLLMKRDFGEPIMLLDQEDQGQAARIDSMIHAFGKAYTAMLYLQVISMSHGFQLDHGCHCDDDHISISQVGAGFQHLVDGAKLSLSSEEYDPWHGKRDSQVKAILFHHIVEREIFDQMPRLAAC